MEYPTVALTAPQLLAAVCSSFVQLRDMGVVDEAALYEMYDFYATDILHIPGEGDRCDHDGLIAALDAAGMIGPQEPEVNPATESTSTKEAA